VDVHQIICDLSGNILEDEMVQHVYSFRDGLIERMDIRIPGTGSMHENQFLPTSNVEEDLYATHGPEAPISNPRLCNGA
jgi:hypothetical protein